MKREDFFEALSDIDENMVAAAEENSEAAKPVIVTAKKSYIKPICAAAACLLLSAAAVVTAVIVRDKLPSDPIAPIAENNEYKTVINVINGGKYPDTLYSPSYDYSKVEFKYIGDEYPNYPNPSKFKSYEELADYSQLVVMGSFTTESGQVAQTYELPDFSQAMTGDYFNKYITFNAFKVEKVLKSNGKIWAGDEILITQPYTIYTHSIDKYPSNEDIPTLYSFSQLTPMLKGDKWVYFLTENSGDYPQIFGEQTYSAVNDYEGRYPVPDEENPYFEYRENTNGVVAPAVFNQGIYSELKEKLENADESKRPTYELDYEKVIGIAAAAGYENNYPTGLNIEFEMEEFEGITFGWQSGVIYTRKNNSEERSNTSIGGTGVYADLCSTFLCDLTGDGKREICTSVSIGSGIVSEFIWVWDYANDKLYYLSDREKYDYSLEKKDGELYLLSRDYPAYEHCEAEEELLTLDMLTEVGTEPEQTVADVNTEPPEDMAQTSENIHKVFDLKDKDYEAAADMPFVFDIEGLPGVTFERMPNKDLGDTLSVTENGVSRDLLWCNEITAIYLCDLSGDGIKDICAEIRFYAGNLSAVYVYDYAQDKQYVLSGCKREKLSHFDYYIQENGGNLQLIKKSDSDGEKYETISDNLSSLDYFTEYDPHVYDNITEYECSIGITVVMPDLNLSGSSDLADKTIEFRMEEYPGVVLRKIDADEPIDNKDNFEIELPYLDKGVFCGFPISSIYLCDLNGDGYREICFNTYFKSETDKVEKGRANIIVIDIAHDTTDILGSKELKYDYILSVVDDGLTVDKYDHKTGEYISSEPLDMGDMETFLPGDM